MVTALKVAMHFLICWFLVFMVTYMIAEMLFMPEPSYFVSLAGAVVITLYERPWKEIPAPRRHPLRGVALPSLVIALLLVTYMVFHA